MFRRQYSYERRFIGAGGEVKTYTNTVNKFIDSNKRGRKKKTLTKITDLFRRYTDENKKKLLENLPEFIEKTLE